MGGGKNSSGNKKIVRAPATKFAHLQKKAQKNRLVAKGHTPADKRGKNTKYRSDEK